MSSLSLFLLFCVIFYVIYLFFFVCGVFVFFFKQKTAYEMRISDWSSDVCSSDLGKNIVPKRECSRSKGASSGMAVAASPCSKRMLARPARCARSVAAATSSGDMSRPSANPVLPVLSAIRLVVQPPDRKSVGSGKSVAVRVAHGGCRIFQTKK